MVFASSRHGVRTAGRATETTRSVKTNDDGRFVICGVPRNVPIRVRASANRLTVDENISSLTDELTSLRLVLKRARRLARTFARMEREFALRRATGANRGSDDASV